jgi:hypothetical protein
VALASPPHQISHILHIPIIDRVKLKSTKASNRIMFILTFNEIRFLYSELTGFVDRAMYP